MGFFNFIFTIVPLGMSFIRVWYNQLKLCISDSSRVFCSRSPLGTFRDMFFSKPFVLPWISGVSQPPLSCFVDATPLRVAGISDKGCFSGSLGCETPIFEAELCAAMTGIYSDGKYTCLSILLATSNYRVRGTCVQHVLSTHDLLVKQVLRQRRIKLF